MAKLNKKKADTTPIVEETKVDALAVAIGNQHGH